MIRSILTKENKEPPTTSNVYQYSMLCCTNDRDVCSILSLVEGSFRVAPFEGFIDHCLGLFTKILMHGREG